MPAILQYAVPSRLFILAIGVLAAVAPAIGQGQDLAEKIEALNVRKKTAHYRLAGTVSDRRLATYGEALEAVYREYEKGFRELLKSETRGKSSTPRSRSSRDDAGGEDAAAVRYPVVIFNNEQEYNEFGRRFISGGSEHTRGMFIPSAKLLLILDQGNESETFEVLFHEAFHQFMHRHVPHAPTWLNEGLATLYGTARFESGKVTFARDRDRWRLTREAIEAGRDLPLSRVVRASHVEFYSPRPVPLREYRNLTEEALFYAQSYTLLNLLLADAKSKARLQDYIRDLAVADAREARKVTERYFSDKLLEQLHDEWERHVKSRPEQRGD